MAVNLAALCDDLRAETAVLEAMLQTLRSADWDANTPAAGWTVRDQVTHLAYFDEAATLAVTDSRRFEVEQRAPATADIDCFTEAVAARHRSLTARTVLGWFRRARASMIDAFLAADPRDRIPWYGPDMSVASAVTARIMETWAHGQDIADTFELCHDPTPALLQVAHLGVRTLPNSFRSHGRAVPEEPVRVALTGPEGDEWLWGPEESLDIVTGSALDFCLVVTQRRHLEDTKLRVRGPVARTWMEIAQAFAGPPGDGRRPGQFAGRLP